MAFKRKLKWRIMELHKSYLCELSVVFNSEFVFVGISCLWQPRHSTGGKLTDKQFSFPFFKIHFCSQSLRWLIFLIPPRLNYANKLKLPSPLPHSSYEPFAKGYDSVLGSVDIAMSYVKTLQCFLGAWPELGYKVEASPQHHTLFLSQVFMWIKGTMVSALQDAVE